MRVILYADTHADGALSFFPTPDAVEVLFELNDNFKVCEKLDGTRRIAGRATLLTIDEAITLGVLQPAALDERFAKVR